MRSLFPRNIVVTPAGSPEIEVEQMFVLVLVLGGGRLCTEDPALRASTLVAAIVRAKAMEHNVECFMFP
jgi:hypothetical protein